MDITIAQRDLSRLLSKAVAVTADKPKKPIMSCVVLDARNNMLVAKASDDDITMSVNTRVACEVATPGIVAVNAKDLLSRVQLHAAGPVRLLERAGKLEIHGIGTKRKHVLQTAAVSDYPSLPEPSGQAPTIRLVSRSLARMLAHVEYAICPEVDRPQMNGSAIEFDGKWMHVVAINNASMARISAEFATDAPLKMLVQQGAALNLRKLIESSRTDADSSNTGIAIEGAHMFFTLAQTRLSVKVLSVPFVDWRQALTFYKHDASVEVHRAKLIDMVKNADVAAKENFIRIDFAPTVLRVWSESDAGESSDDTAVTYDGKSFTVGLTTKVLLDALNALESDSVRLLVDSSGDAGLNAFFVRPVTEKTDEQFDGIIMPRRI